MSVKQDRSGVRTPAQLEQKYNFGKTFSEMLGLINDNRDKVDSASSGLKDLEKSSTELSRTTEEIKAQVQTLSQEVELKMNKDAVTIAVKNEIANGVNQIVTESGYRFDAEGLKISKSGEAIENVIDNTGMYVKYFDEDVLTANDKGVDAVNLHAKTYLIIGTGNGRSRFEDYGISRTGCFWVGG